MEDKIFKFVKVDDKYFIHKEDTLINIDKHMLEDRIKDSLCNKNIKVEEYENNKLIREGYPGNWKDFTDICIGDTCVPSICSVKIYKNNIDFSFMRTSENIIYTCKFEDDDVYSHLNGILAEVNAFEVVYDDKSLCKIFSMLSHLSNKEMTSLILLKKFLKIENINIKEYVRPNICKIDIKLLNCLSIYKEKDYCVLNQFKCNTNQGRRLLFQWIKQPLRNKEEILYRQQIVEEINNLEIDINLLREFPDLYKLTKKIFNNRITVNEIINLYQVIIKIPKLLNFVNRQKLENDFYKPLYEINNRLKILLVNIDDIIDINNSTHIIHYKGNGLVELNLLLKNNKDQILEEYKRLQNICDKIKYEEKDGMFRITRVEYKNNENLLRDHILICSILKNGINFTTKTLSDLIKERDSIIQNINRETSSMVNNLREKIKDFGDEIEILNYITALLDVFTAFSSKCTQSGWSKPCFGNIINIKGCFHPLLEDKDVIYNDLILEDPKVCIITGPNMGGKSTFLKTIGVISILAQVGCYVPAESATVPLFDGIYIRIGAQDCVHSGDSTFMVEMKDISRICRMSTSSSLILIDELGRGTSEGDGLSIAMAVKDFIKELGSYTLFATHFPELCDASSLNMKASYDGLTLLYKIVHGVCDTSFGINVAEKVGFPESVLKEIEAFQSNKQ